MADNKDYPKLDTPIDEEIEIERTGFEVSPDGKKAFPKTVTEKVKVKTIYTQKKLYSNICADYAHDWIVPDKHNWTAVCKNCPKRLFLDPLTQTVKEGKIVNRLTGQHIS